MKKDRITIALVWAALLCICQTSASKDVAVKAMTYNIYSARNLGIQSIADVVKKENPDILCLQEVERNTDVNPTDFPKVLSQLTGMKYYYFIHALDLKKGDYGNVILSKYPISEGKTYKLGFVNKSYIRSFGYVKIKKDGKAFYFATTHLDHKKDDASRMRQVYEILAYCRQLDKPVILGGDFNAHPDEKPVTTLLEWFALGCPDGRCDFTVPTPTPKSTIDYLMYAPAEAFAVTDYRVCMDADKESDHFPVVATFLIH